MKEKRSHRERFTGRFSDLRNYFSSRRRPFTLLNVPPPVPGQIPGQMPNMPQAAGKTITREERRLYVGNISTNITKTMLLQFFNQQMHILGLGPILTCKLFSDKKFAFLEFGSPEETTRAMVLDGINLMGNNLKIRRPDNYQPTDKPQSDYISSYVQPDSPNVVYIGALPNYIKDEQVKELLQPFGKLRAFKHIKDTTTGLSKGFAFCEYMDASVTDQAIDALNWMQLCDRKLIVQRASVGPKKAQTADQSVADPVCLHNTVTPDELRDSN
ncbi:hypothetical protein KR038_011746 [Drosophila bunnanda]|nr:hypothetical protein KR038_011746 [Drosophila bunnanda]